MVPGSECLDVGANFDDDASPFVTQDRGKDPLGIRTGKRIRVRVTNAGGCHLDQSFPCLRAFELHGFDRKGLAGRVGHRCAGFHETSFAEGA